PRGVSFKDKEGHERKEMRTRWWDSNLTTFRSACIGPPADNIPDLPIPGQLLLPTPDRPTFIGHYWLDPHAPLKPLTHCVACADYSVAHRGRLVAYRFDGERELSAEKFVSV